MNERAEIPIHHHPHEEPPAKALRDTLPTLLSQTTPATEILIVDQSANDETRQLVIDAEAGSGSLGARAPQFVYMYEPKLTCAGAARNVAIDRASGDILVFLMTTFCLSRTFWNN